LILFSSATTLMVYRARPRRGQTFALLFWALLSPAMMYVLNPLTGFFSQRYAWWIMLGVALWVGWGLSYLPRPVNWLVGIVLVAAMNYPLPLTAYTFGFSSLGDNLAWLQKHVQTGDVFLRDSGAICGEPEEWDYYLRTYFPNGLAFVDDPAGYRRVWYIVSGSEQSHALSQAVNQDRIQRIFAGPPGCQFRLYEAPPDAAGIVFENGMRFHGAEVMERDLPWSGPVVRRRSETLRLRLWWSVDQPVELDYSVGTYILRGNALLAEVNSAPQVIFPADAPPETSRWRPDQYYVEEREFSLPNTGKGDFEMALAVYHWQDGNRLNAPGVTADRLLPIGHLFIKAW
jgi:hypothetical protein